MVAHIWEKIGPRSQAASLLRVSCASAARKCRKVFHWKESTISRLCPERLVTFKHCILLEDAEFSAPPPPPPAPLTAPALLFGLKGEGSKGGQFL